MPSDLNLTPRSNVQIGCHIYQVYNGEQLTQYVHNGCAMRLFTSTVRSIPWPAVLLDHSPWYQTLTVMVQQQRNAVRRRRTCLYTYEPFTAHRTFTKSTSYARDDL